MARGIHGHPEESLRTAMPYFLHYGAGDPWPFYKPLGYPMPYAYANFESRVERGLHLDKSWLLTGSSPNFIKARMAVGAV
jgi:hypothetical protein